MCGRISPYILLNCLSISSGEQNPRKVKRVCCLLSREMTNIRILIAREIGLEIGFRRYGADERKQDFLPTTLSLPCRCLSCARTLSLYAKSDSVARKQLTGEIGECIRVYPSNQFRRTYILCVPAFLLTKDPPAKLNLIFPVKKNLA